MTKKDGKKTSKYVQILVTGVRKHLKSRIRVNLDMRITAPRTQWDNEHSTEHRKTFFPH